MRLPLWHLECSGHLVFGPHFEWYVGGENITNVKQPQPIISAETRLAPILIVPLYGPIFGSMYYMGLRYQL